ncbi:conserved hypothetical protein [Vibrio phage 142E35-1]|nr:conserved hypothetical protein [Vibrio phage 142E35-1]
MSTEIIQIDDTDWTQITTDNKSGSYLVIGSNSVYIYQGPTAPTAKAGAAPMMDIVQSSHPKPYCGLGGEFLFARTVSGIAQLHITPEG